MAPTLDMSIGPKATMLPSFAPSSLLPVVFLLVCLVWVIYTLIITYHWFRYGRNSWLAVPVIVTHLTVSAFIILFAASGLR